MRSSNLYKVRVIEARAPDVSVSTVKCFATLVRLQRLGKWKYTEI